MTMTVGELEIKLFAELARLREDMNQAKSIVKTATDSIASYASMATNALGAIGVGLSLNKIESMGKALLDTADALYILSQRTGIAVENLVGLELAAKMNGSSMDGVAMGVKKLSTFMAEAALGGKNQADTLRILGVSAKEPLAAMQQLADMFAKMPDGAAKSALAVKLFGKTGTEMIPVLNGGSQALHNMIEEGKKLNPVSAQFAADANAFNDNLDRISAGAKGVGNALMERLLPGLQRNSDAMVKFIEQGNLLGAMFTAWGAAGNLFWDAIFPPENLQKSIQSTEQIKQLETEISKLKIELSSPYSGSFLDRLFGESAEDQNKRLVMLKNQLETLQNHGALMDFIQNEKGVSKPKQDTTVLDRLAKAEAQRKLDEEGIKLTDRMSNSMLKELGVIADLSKGSEILAQIDDTKQHPADVMRLIALAKLVDSEDELKRAKTARIEQMVYDLNVQTKIDEKQDGFTHTLRDQIEMQGKSKDEIELTNYMRQLEGDGLDQLSPKYAQYKKQLEELLLVRKQYDYDWKAGAISGMRDYADAVYNMAQSTHDAVTRAFKGMEDALTSFVMTGKLDFSSLANSIIADMVRIQIQQSITGPLAMSLAAMGSGWSSAGGGQYTSTNYEGVQMTTLPGKALGGDVFSGQSYMVGEQGAEMFTPRTSGTITPHNKLGGGITFSPVINIDSRTDQAQILQLVDGAMQTAQYQLVDKLQRQGRL